MLRGYGSSRAHRGEDHGQLARGDCDPPDQNHLEEASSMISPVFKAIDLEAEDRGYTLERSWEVFARENRATPWPRLRLIRAGNSSERRSGNDDV
jgi:hypothetical protein